MNILVYLPKSQEDVQKLQQNLAFVHSEAVLRYIQEMRCPKNQKLNLLDEVKKAYRENR